MATIAIEIECEVTGEVCPPDPGAGVMSAYVEDVSVDCAVMLVVRWSRATKRYVQTPVDLLDGLDAKARGIVLGNIADAFANEISDAVLDDRA